MRFFIKLYAKKDVRYPSVVSIYIRINVASKVAYHFSGIRLKPNQWDEKKGMVKPSTAASSKIREALESMMEKFTSAGLELAASGKPFSAVMIKERALSEGSKTLGSVLQEVYEHYQGIKNISEALLVRQAIKRLAALKQDNILPSEITSMWFESMAGKMGKSSLSSSTIRVRLTELNKYLKLAASKGIVDYDDKAYRYATLPRAKSKEKTYLNIDEIDKIFEYWKTLGPGRKKYALSAYLISFYLYGLRISDVLSITRSQIDDSGKIKIIERKTQKSKFVPVPDRAIDIFNSLLNEEFWANKSHDYYGSHFLIPLMRHYMIRGNSPEEKEHAHKKEIMYVTKVINEYLRFITTMLGIKGNITCHTARHSFAVLAAQIHKDDIRVVQELLNHSSMRTTEIYLHSLESSRLDNAARKIFKIAE